MGGIAGLVGFLASVVVAVILVGKLAPYVGGEDSEQIVSQSYTIAIVMALVASAVVGGAVFGMASGIASRLTDLGLAVSKMGLGTKTSVRVTGNDEISVLGRSLSSLSSDIASLSSDQAEGGAAVHFDPQMRELRDKALPLGGFAAPDGFELDAAISAGSRGGTDYFDCHPGDESAVMYLVSAASGNAIGALAARLARDEIARALGAGANARKALSHTNRVLHKTMPRGVCALATVLEIGADEAKIYQAGSRVPVVLCSAGELEDLTAEGFALGLDSGPVFEKGLRENTLQMTKGMRLVVLNDAGNRNDELVQSVCEHSPKHTTPFMNMVLGELEEDAGSDGLREDVVLMTVKRS